jgi:hypothetical protein
VKPDSSNPNPSFHVNSDPDPDPGFDDQKQNKKNSWKFFYIFFDQKLLGIYLSLGLLNTSKLQEKPSALKREHQALQKLNVCRWFRFAQLAKGKKFRP